MSLRARLGPRLRIWLAPLIGGLALNCTGGDSAAPDTVTINDSGLDAEREPLRDTSFGDTIALPEDGSASDLSDQGDHSSQESDQQSPPEAQTSVGDETSINNRNEGGVDSAPTSKPTRRQSALRSPASSDSQR